MKIKYGRVTLFGRPNVGKSTLLNNILQQKVSITSPMPQTTRKNIRAVYESDEAVIIFSDTPGIIDKVEDLVGKKVNLEAPKELDGSDVLVMVVDISRPKSEEENKSLGLIRKSQAKKILVYNKMDKAFGPKNHRPDYLYLEDEFDQTIEVSALKRKNVKGLINIIIGLLPSVDKKKVDEQMADMKGPVMMESSQDYMADIIREKAYLELRQEVPYSMTVKVEPVEEKGRVIVIKAKILTTEDRYKKMIIGRGGQKIKQIGFRARKEFELMTGKKVYLDLQVEVDKHWPEREFIN